MDYWTDHIRAAKLALSPSIKGENELQFGLEDRNKKKKVR